MSKSKQIGTAGETAVVNYLSREGVLALNPRRVVLHGSEDEGDVEYTAPTGVQVTVQVKSGKAAEQASAEQVERWVIVTEGQAARAGNGVSFLVTKRAGVGAPRAELWRAHCRGYTLGLQTGAIVSMSLAAMVSVVARMSPAHDRA